MTDTAPDQVAAYLTEVRERIAAAEPVLRRGADWAAAKSATDVPRLLAAVERLLKIHVTDERALLCAGCADVWPCQDYRAISAALLGEETTDGR